MDPDATLRMINEFLEAKESGEEVDYLVEALYQWIERGGFEPGWHKYPLATSYYDTRIAGARRHGLVATKGRSAFLTDEDVREKLEEIHFKSYSQFPKKKPENGLRVQAGYGTVEMEEWTLTEPPDDEAHLESWKENPVLKVSFSFDIEKLFEDKDAKWRGSYSGDEGWLARDVASMSKKKQQAAIIAIVLSYNAYYGGSEEFVSEVG